MKLRWLVGLLLLSASSVEARAQSVQLQSREAGKIKGVVFDSLRMIPLKGVTVMLMEGAQKDTTNFFGEFELKDVLPGKHLVAFTSLALDSLGLGTLGTPVTVNPGETVSIKLATPSFKTLWTFRCGNQPAMSADSGIVWGTIRDAASYKELAGATAQFSWYDLDNSVKLGLGAFKEVRKNIGTDESGLYVACGVPTDIRVGSSALGPASASGEVEYQVGVLRLQRMDFLVSTDMVIPDSVHFASAADSIAAQRARGHGIVRGTVLDYRKKPMANANVRVVDVDTSAQTGKNGQFQIGGLPAGTHVVQVRRVGYAPYSEIVHLRPDSAAELRVQMPDINTLSTINVRANITKGSYRLAYEDRRRQGQGYFLDPKAMGRKTDLGGILAEVPTVLAHRQPNGMYVTVPDPRTFYCTLIPFLDGMATTWEIIHMRTPDKYRAIEVYPKGRLVPQEYVMKAGQVTNKDLCGVVLFWSYGVKW